MYHASFLLRQRREKENAMYIIESKHVKEDPSIK